MPRSYSNWNSRRRPEPRLFQTFGSPSETSPLAELAARGPLAAGFGDDEMLPSASSPNDASLDLEDLVAGIAEGDAEFFASDVLGGGVGVGLNAVTASSPLTLAALQQQQAQQHQFAQLQPAAETAATPDTAAAKRARHETMPPLLIDNGSDVPTRGTPEQLDPPGARPQPARHARPLG